MADEGHQETLRAARVAFTGRLASMTRREAHDLVRSVGGVPTTSVSGQTSYLVIGMHGWPLQDDGSVSLKLQRAERLRGRWGRARIVSEVRFLELAGVRDRAPAVRKSYPIERVSELLGVDRQTIEHWELLGLVRSDRGSYDFQDIVSLQTIASLVDRGVGPHAIRKSLTGLASFVPGTERPLAQLKIVTSESGELLAQVGDALIDPNGQQFLDFDRKPAPEAASLPPATAPRESADELFEQAVWLEELERYEEAADAYRRTIALAPHRSDVYFNLGNVLRMEGRDDAAEELYRLAVALDPAHELAWYNLADVQEEGGRFRDAVASLRRAVEASPSFADGHFNLAACLEQIGDPEAARTHWRQYLRLDPASEWAQIARERVERLAISD